MALRSPSGGSLIDPWGSSKVVTVQVRAPKVRKDSIGDGAVDEAVAEEEASAQRKRVSLQRQAAVTVEAAEDYARRFESGVNEVSLSLPIAALTSVVVRRGMMMMITIIVCCEDDRFSNEEELAQCGVNVMVECASWGKVMEARERGGCFLVKPVGRSTTRIVSSLGLSIEVRCCYPTFSGGGLICFMEFMELSLVPGDPNKFVFCKRCDAAYHCYCQHPPHKNVSSGPYLCPKHTRCHSCDSTVPGNGLSVRWFLSYTCCDACGRLFVKGNYCPLCLKVYRDSESTPMVCCDLCQRWVHCHCDGISDEKYLQFQADGNLQYKCATCRGEGYQVKDLQDAVQELWKKKDMVDAELVASLRAAAGLPTDEEIFSISPFSDDEENGPVSGRSVKLSIKGLVDNPQRKARSTENMLDSDVHHGMESQRSRLSGAKTDSFGIQMNERSDVRSSVAGICSTHEPRIVKHKRVDDVMVTDEEKPSRIVRIKCSNKPQDSDSEETSLKAKKLVINLGARKKMSAILPSPMDRDQSSGEVRTLKISGRFGKTKSEGSKGTFGSITQFPASTSAGSHVDDKTSISPSLQKEARPLLKFKLRKPDSGDQTSLATTQSEDEKLSSGKGQRSKRKRPSSLVDKASLEEDGDSRQDSPRSDEMMDANWILKKLGKDSIGKRVEVQGSQNSWNKGTVTDVIRDTSTLSVSLDDGSMKTFELGKHNVRFIPQKQKRSRS
ncbi:hypothetical protein HID58_044849 [Brassica napus]|uniref:PHD-type domain-containing protein n=1 Tax=Brassica napus TaxID=3708 RepID=A0ABQ7XFN3_BRANA|nr:hypothetical protein HID58_044849 [Brassica napus]